MHEAPAQPPSWMRPLRVLIVVLIALLAALLIWQIVGGGEGDDSGDAGGGTAETPRIVGAPELAELAASSGRPLYWAGPRPGAELEYSEADGGRAYVRYLTGGAEAGDPSAAYLTVATYPLPDPVAALRANAKRTATELREARGGALVWVDPSRPSSVYLAEAGSDYQVEVYDPDPARALDVALSGDIRPG